MKSIQTTAIVLWTFIFIAVSFVAGQILASKGVFDITAFVTGKVVQKDNSTDVKNDDTVINDDVINKIGQETVRVGLNVAKSQFTTYYKDYVNYIMANDDIYAKNNKVTITNKEASDYVFYALSRNVDVGKYTANMSGNKINISEANINAFIDTMFEKSIDEAYKKIASNGYSKTNKEYSIDKNTDIEEYSEKLTNIQNVTSNQIILTYNCKKIEKKDSKENVVDEKNINITIVYRGGRYIVTEVEKLEK